MSARMQVKHLWSSWLSTKLVIVSLLFGGVAGCAPVVSPATPTLLPDPSPTVPIEATMPPEWETYTSQSCEYAISYPPEMQVTNEGVYSRTLGFKLANPDEGARNFIYVSVIFKEFQDGSGEGVYNYEPAEAEILLNMQVGESKSLRDDPNTAQFFTYARKPDTPIGDYPAKTYENTQLFEFPMGTKEIRYYLSVNQCTYLIGGYMDTTGSNQLGAITEDLFSQIVSTFRLVP